MKFLIVGGTGYIGGAFIDFLVSNGYQVANMSRRVHPNRDVENFIIEDEIDIESYKNFAPDIILYFAACYDNNNLDQILKVNVRMPLKILSTLKNTCAKFIYIGSYWELGDRSAPQIPIDLYSASKQSFLSFLKYYSLYEKVQCCEVILYGTYGNEDRRDKLVNYILNAVSSKSLIKLSPGYQKLNLVHVKSLMLKLNEIIVNNTFDEFKRYAICSDKEWTPRDIVKIIQNVDPDFEVEFGAREYRNVELMNPNYLDNSFFVEDELLDFIRSEIGK